MAAKTKIINIFKERIEMSELTKVAVKKINVNNNKRRASSFIMTDTYIFNALKTNHKTLAVYMQLKSMLNNIDGTCCPSLDTMAKELGMNKSTVSRAVKELQELGFINWAEVKEGRYPTRYYLFKYPQDMNGKCVDESTEEEVVTEEDKAIIAQYTTTVSAPKQEKQLHKGPKPKLIKKKDKVQEPTFEQTKKDISKMLNKKDEKSSYSMDVWKDRIKIAESLHKEDKVELAYAKLAEIVRGVDSFDNYPLLREYAFEVVISLENGTYRNYYLEKKQIMENGTTLFFKDGGQCEKHNIDGSIDYMNNGVIWKTLSKEEAGDANKAVRAA